MISIPSLGFSHHSQALINQSFSLWSVTYISPKGSQRSYWVFLFPFSNLYADLFPQGLEQFTFVCHSALTAGSGAFPSPHLSLLYWIYCLLSCHLSCQGLVLLSLVLILHICHSGVISWIQSPYMPESCGHCWILLVLPFLSDLCTEISLY